MNESVMYMLHNPRGLGYSGRGDRAQKESGNTGLVTI